MIQLQLPLQSHPVYNGELQLPLEAWKSQVEKVVYLSEVFVLEVTYLDGVVIKAEFAEAQVESAEFDFVKITQNDVQQFVPLDDHVKWLESVIRG